MREYWFLREIFLRLDFAVGLLGVWLDDPRFRDAELGIVPHCISSVVAQFAGIRWNVSVNKSVNEKSVEQMRERIDLARRVIFLGLGLVVRELLLYHLVGANHGKNRGWKVERGRLGDVSSIICYEFVKSTIFFNLLNIKFLQIRAISMQIFTIIF